MIAANTSAPEGAATPKKPHIRTELAMIVAWGTAGA